MMEFLYILQSVTVLLSLVLVLSSGYIVGKKIRDAHDNEKKIIEIIKHNQHLKKKLLGLRVSNHSKKEFTEVLVELENEINKKKENEKIIQMLEENTEEGRIRYINNLRLSL